MSAIRLTFSVDQGVPKFSRSQVVEMRAPPARHADRIDIEAGTWLETRDAKGNRLYSHILDSTILSPMVEVRTGVGDPGLTLVKSRASQPLHVVVPHDPAAKSFHILHREEKGGKAKELLSSEL